MLPSFDFTPPGTRLSIQSSALIASSAFAASVAVSHVTGQPAASASFWKAQLTRTSCP